VWRSLGKVQYGALTVESASLKERPSIYVVRAMTKGERFTDHNIRVIRPANGLAPKYYDSLVGRACARDIAAGVPLEWEFVENGAPHNDSFTENS